MAKGAEQLKSTIEQIHGGLENTSKQASLAGQSMTTSFAATSRALEKVLAGSKPLADVMGKIGQVAGLAGDAMKEKLVVTTELLQKTMTEKFAPAVNMVSERLLNLVASKRNLTEAQAQSLKGWVNQYVALGEFQKRMESARGAVESFGRAAAIGFAAATGALTGWITAGIANSSVGQQMAFWTERLSRSIAGLFGPEIKKAIGWIQDAVNWIQKLTAEQRTNLVRWIEAGIAALGVAMIMPKVFSGIMTVITAVRTLSLAMAGLSASITATGIGAIVQVIGVAVAAMSGLVLGTQEGRDAFAELGKAFAPLIKEVGRLIESLSRLLLPAILEIIRGFNEVIAIPVVQTLEAIANALDRVLGPALDRQNSKLDRLVQSLALAAALGPFSLLVKEPDKEKKPGQDGNRNELPRRSSGFESLTGAWERIAMASLKAGFGKSIEEKHLDVAEQQLQEQRQTNKQLGKMQPAIV